MRPINVYGIKNCDTMKKSPRMARQPFDRVQLS